MTIAFLGRDGGTERAPKTIKALIDNLAKSDATLRAALSASGHCWCGLHVTCRDQCDRCMKRGNFAPPCAGAAEPVAWRAAAACSAVSKILCGEETCTDEGNWRCPQDIETADEMIVEIVDAVIALAVRGDPVQPGAGEREQALRDEIFCLREVVRGVRILDHAGRFKDYDGEPWLKRVRNIGLDHDPVEFNRQASSSEGGR